MILFLCPVDIGAAIWVFGGLYHALRQEPMIGAVLLTLPFI